jgi:hypothetical protein
MSITAYFNATVKFIRSEFWQYIRICRKTRHKEFETYDRFLIFAVTGYT